MRCRDVMWKDPISVKPDDVAQSAIKKLAEAAVGALPVVDDEGRYVGLITQTGILRGILAEDLDPKLTRIALVIERRIPTVEPDDPVAVALKRMDEANVRWLPVIAGDRVTGMVAARDIRGAARSDDAHDLHAVTDAALVH